MLGFELAHLLVDLFILLGEQLLNQGDVFFLQYLGCLLYTSF